MWILCYMRYSVAHILGRPVTLMIILVGFTERPQFLLDVCRLYAMRKYIRAESITSVVKQ